MTEDRKAGVATSLRLVIAGSAMALAVGCAGVPKPAADASDRSLLIAGAAIVDTEEGAVSAPSDLLIADGRIVEIADAGAIDRDRATRVIEAASLFALPGLIDVHAHIGDGGLGEQSGTDREAALAQFVRYGVTTIFAPGGGGGNDEYLSLWRARCATGEILCPDLFGSGDLITAPWSHPIGTIWGMPRDYDPAEAHARGAVALAEDEPAGPLLDRKLAAGVDAIKIVVEDGLGPVEPMPRLSTAKIAEIVREAHARDLRVFAHVSRVRHVADAVAAGVDGVMHSSEDSIPDALLAEMAANGAFYVATLALYEGFLEHARGRFEPEPFALDGVSSRAVASLEDPELRLPPDAFGTLEEARRIRAAIDDNLQRAAAAGVPLALGTDTANPRVFPGYAAHQELALMVDAGLTSARALAAATLGGAVFLRAEDRLGRLAPGYEADLLLLGANPLDDVRATRDLRAVIVDGRRVRHVSAPDAAAPAARRRVTDPREAADRLMESLR